MPIRVALCGVWKCSFHHPGSRMCTRHWRTRSRQPTQGKIWNGSVPTMAQACRWTGLSLRYTPTSHTKYLISKKSFYTEETSVIKEQYGFLFRVILSFCLSFCRKRENQSVRICPVVHNQPKFASAFLVCIMNQTFLPHLFLSFSFSVSF